MSYTTGSWRGHPNHSCDACAYATLNERSMRVHQARCDAKVPLRAARMILTEPADPTLVEPDEQPTPEAVDVDAPTESPED